MFKSGYRGSGPAWRNRLATGASVTALSVALLAVPAHAQESDDTVEPGEVIVVRGVRASLQNAQAMRRDADVLMDAVTAEDIGALPDRSVAEALQRVPGVNITRFEGANDPDHFSVEGTGATVRGLTFTRSELNGRDVFSADDGQQIGFNDIPPELLGSVQVFKNQSAEMIEGGLSGTVNLNTRLPFDSAENIRAFSLEANYSDLREAFTPGVSGVFSQRWEMNDGSEFGVLIGGSYSELDSRADGTLIADFIDRDGNGQYAPSGAGIRTQLFDRERSSIAAAAQWSSADGQLEATAQFFRATYENAWSEHAIEPSIDDGPGIVPAPGTSFNFDENGLFESGVISQSVGWRSNDPSLPLNGVRNLVLNRERLDQSENTDFGFNLKWAPTDRFRANFDFQYAESTAEVADVTLHSAFFADTALDTTSDIPTVTYRAPADGSDPYFEDLNNYYIRSAMDHLSDNESEFMALKADGEYDFSGDHWLESIKFGVRVSERDQVVRRSTFNWGNISATWNTPFALDNAAIPAGTFELRPLENFQRSGHDNGIPNGVPFYTGELGFNYDAGVSQIFALREAAGNGGWVPLAQRGGVVAGTPFLPSEITDVTQETQAAYIQFNFAQDNFLGTGMHLDGNFGVRYVETTTSAAGALSFPDSTLFLNGLSPTDFCAAAAGGGGGSLPGFCLLPQSEQDAFAAWADGTNRPLSAENGYENILPSLNARLEVTEDVIVRLGVSQAMYRPDFGFARSNFVIQDRIGQDDPVTGQWLRPLASTGNINLDPATATNFDLALEWYFADVGSLTLTYFHKDLDNVVTPGVSVQTFENNGVEFDVNVNGVANAPDSGSIQGFEVAYQQTYDFLPGLFGNLGTQINYTYIDANAVPVLQPNNTAGNGGASSVFDVSGLGFPLLSEDTFNFVGFYEDDRFSARLAWNWRSDYTLTTRDVIFPFSPITHESTGQLDGSFFYTVNDYITVGVQGVNLLDEVSQTRAVLNEAGLNAPRNSFTNDRRFAFVVRGTF